MFDLFLREVVHLDKRSKVGIKRGESLSTSPFILHDTEKIDHLVAKRGEMAGRRGVGFARDAKPLLDELLQAPAGAVTGEHGQVMEMEIAVAVCIGNLLVIDF